MPTPAHAPELLLFDLGGVLIENRMFAELKRLTGSSATEEELIEHWLANPLARRFELGRCSPDDFARQVIAEFDLELSPAEFLAAFETWPQGFSPDALALLADLRRRYRIACLSNSNEVHWSARLTEPFDAAFSSHRIGHIKPDPEAFLYVLERLGVDASRVVYFDDAASNVAAARRLGIEAWRTPGMDSVRSRLELLELI